MIVFIPRSDDGCKAIEEGDGEWLPQPCPACGHGAVIGHGRRWRQAHDQTHDKIRVRRGLCKGCHVTLTVLPAWCIAGAPYTLYARQHAMIRLAGGESAEQAAPDCRDANRTIDPSTIRRWFWRRIKCLLFLWSPTLLAWDFRAVTRILVAEGFSP